MGRHKFYSSKKWQDCRNAYASSKRWLCERCLEKGLYHKGAIVHHKIYITEQNINDTSITLNEKNLMYVCKECHDSYDGHGVKGRKGKELSVIFSTDGQPIRRLK